MTFGNPNPFANPLNSSWQRHTGMTISHQADAKNLIVPNQDVPMFGTPEWYAKCGNASNRLTVPNQDVPLGDQLRGSGFLPGRDDLFMVSDGTILNFKTGKVVRAARRVPGYWGDPDADISMRETENTRREPTLDELISNPDAYAGTATPSGELLEPIDPDSAAYWLRAEEEAEKLVGNMTAAQKAAIADFERHFPKSRLIDEAKKSKSAGKIFLKG